MVIDKTIQNSSSLVNILRVPGIVVCVEVANDQSARGKGFKEFEIPLSQVAVRRDVHIDNIYAVDIDCHAFEGNTR